MTLEDINVRMFHYINQFAGKNPYVDYFMIFSAQIIIILVPIALVYLWLKRERKFTVFLLLSIFFSLLISFIIGHIYYHPRPFVLNLTTPLISHTADSSFPSDHAVVMFSFTLPFFFFKRYKWGTSFFLLSILVGVARIYCGVHYPFDIIGSFLIALIVAYILFILRGEIFNILSKFSWLNTKQFKYGKVE